MAQQSEKKTPVIGALLGMALTLGLIYVTFRVASAGWKDGR
jgi:hypothetical protein